MSEQHSTHVELSSTSGQGGAGKWPGICGGSLISNISTNSKLRIFLTTFSSWKVSQLNGPLPAREGESGLGDLCEVAASASRCRPAVWSPSGLKRRKCMWWSCACNEQGRVSVLCM